MTFRSFGRMPGDGHRAVPGYAGASAPPFGRELNPSHPLRAPVVHGYPHPGTGLGSLEPF